MGTQCNLLIKLHTIPSAWINEYTGCAQCFVPCLACVLRGSVFMQEHSEAQAATGSNASDECIDRR